MNSIYEQLNKINDTESLSEKYNVKNAKELKKLKESISSIKIPAPWNKYLEVDNYSPEEGEYAVGDKIGEYTLVAYLVPKAEYEDIIDEWPMLFKNSEGHIVGTTSHDRVYLYELEDFGLEESLNEGIDDAARKLRAAAEKQKLFLKPWFEEYALEDNGDHVDEVIKNEIIPVGRAVKKAFPNVAQWWHHDDDRFNAIQIVTWRKNASRWGDWDYQGFFEYAHGGLFDITDVVHETNAADNPKNSD